MAIPIRSRSFQYGFNPILMSIELQIGNGASLFDGAFAVILNLLDHVTPVVDCRDFLAAQRTAEIHRLSNQPVLSIICKGLFATAREMAVVIIIINLFSLVSIHVI